MSIETMKQALTALERQDVIGWSATINALRAAYTALKEWRQKQGAENEDQRNERGTH